MERHPVKHQNFISHSMHGCSLEPDGNWDLDEDNLVEDFQLNDDNISIGDEMESLPLQKVSGVVYDEMERNGFVEAELHLIDVSGKGRSNITVKTDNDGIFILNDVQCGTYILEKIGTEGSKEESLLLDVWDGEDIENVIFGNMPCGKTKSVSFSADRRPLLHDFRNESRQSKTAFISNNHVEARVVDSMFGLSFGPENSTCSVSKTEDLCRDNSDSDLSFHNENDETMLGLKVSGFVYNINGIGVENVHVQLNDIIQKSIHKIEKTDSNGLFSFYNVPRGAYILRLDESSLLHFQRLPRCLLKSKVVDMWSGTDFEGFIFGKDPNSVIHETVSKHKTGETVQAPGLTPGWTERPRSKRQFRMASERSMHTISLDDSIDSLPEEIKPWWGRVCSC